MSMWNAGQVSHPLCPDGAACFFTLEWKNTLACVCVHACSCMCAFRFLCVCEERHTLRLICALLWLPWQHCTKLCWKAQGHSGACMAARTHTQLHAHTITLTHFYFLSTFLLIPIYWLQHKQLSVCKQLLSLSLCTYTHTDTHSLKLSCQCYKKTGAFKPSLKMSRSSMTHTRLHTQLVCRSLCTVSEFKISPLSSDRSPKCMEMTRNTNSITSSLHPKSP